MVPSVVCRPLRAILPALCVSALLLTFAQGQQVTYSSEHRQAERFSPQKATASEQKLKQKLALGRQGLSLVTADFDQDGSNDLIQVMRRAIVACCYCNGASTLLLRRGPVNVRFWLPDKP